MKFVLVLGLVCVRASVRDRMTAFQKTNLPTDSRAVQKMSTQDKQRQRVLRETRRAEWLARIAHSQTIGAPPPDSGISTEEWQRRMAIWKSLDAQERERRLARMTLRNRVRANFKGDDFEEAIWRDEVGRGSFENPEAQHNEDNTPIAFGESDSGHGGAARDFSSLTLENPVDTGTSRAVVEESLEEGADVGLNLDESPTPSNLLRQAHGIPIHTVLGFGGHAVPVPSLRRIRSSELRSVDKLWNSLPPGWEERDWSPDWYTVSVEELEDDEDERFWEELLGRRKISPSSKSRSWQEFWDYIWGPAL